jgi:glycosyltransferase involved in cell wall biosynthesis
MRTLILAAGRFGGAMKRDIADGREPRLDVFQIADVLNADVIDYQDLDRSMLAKRLVGRGSGRSAGVAWLGFREHHRYDAVLTTGEDIGLPFAALMKSSTARCSHTMIAHTLFPFKKQVFFRYLGAASRIDRVLAYSTSEERHMIERLGLPEHKVQRIFYHADENFFRPDAREPEPDLICAAGQLLRDYDCLIEAVRDLPVRVQIAAGSPWIDHKLEPSRELPKNVSWGKLGRYDLRELYARSALAVVPTKRCPGSAWHCARRGGYGFEGFALGGIGVQAVLVARRATSRSKRGMAVPDCDEVRT